MLLLLLPLVSPQALNFQHLGRWIQQQQKKLIINGPTSVQHQSGTFSFAGYLFAHLNKSESIAAAAK